jgi:hypothetical protein
MTFRYSSRNNNGGRRPRPRHTRRQRKTRTPTPTPTCSPIVDGLTSTPYTCYTEPILIKLKERWNARHPDSKIETTEPKEIWMFLKTNLQNVCEEEKCWIKQNFVDETTKQQIREIAFVPEAPPEWEKNPNTWLSSVDITNVMRQYENRYKCFKFIGPSPIDFDEIVVGSGECVWEELCKFSLDKYLDSTPKITKIGMIFNLDKSTQSGSHWVSMFLNIKEHVIFYFDSTGEPIPSQIETLKNRIIRQAKNRGIQLKFDQNKRVHQKENTECGMYSLFFIISMLLDTKNIEYFKGKNGGIPDGKMEEFRDIYFS